MSTGDADAGYQPELLASLVGAVDFFCINDTTDNATPQDPRLVQARQTLQRLFPLPSRFERKEAGQRIAEPSRVV